MSKIIAFTGRPGHTVPKESRADETHKSLIAFMQEEGFDGLIGALCSIIDLLQHLKSKEAEQ